MNYIDIKSPLANITIGPFVVGDKFEFPFAYYDDVQNAVSFSGITGARMYWSGNNTGTEFMFASTGGSTYKIDISDSGFGVFNPYCNALNVPADTYNTQFEVYDTLGTTTIMISKINLIEKL